MIGSVVALFEVRMTANRNSFHTNENVSRNVAIRPGSVSGSAMRRNAVKRLSPSMYAASSISTGSCLK